MEVPEPWGPQLTGNDYSTKNRKKTAVEFDGLIQKQTLLVASTRLWIISQVGVKIKQK